MNNKNLETMLSELNIDNKRKDVPREKFTTNLDKNMLCDYRELCNALKIQYNEGIEIMFDLLSNNKEYLKDFLDEARRL